MTPATIQISSVLPREGTRHRSCDPAKVNLLAESIQEIGLQTPISVYAIVSTPGSSPAQTQQYRLIAGEHRLEACRSLGWPEIPAFILELSNEDRELWEIDENLMRSDLNELERAEHLQRRKELYEQKHSETRKGGDHGNQHTGGRRRQSANSAFSQDTARKTGLSQRAIQQHLRRAVKIAPSVREEIRSIPAIATTGVELDRLAELDPREQVVAVEAVRTGKAASVRGFAAEYTPQRRRRGKRLVPELEVADLLRRWEKARNERATGIQIYRTDKGNIRSIIILREGKATALTGSSKE